MQSYILFTIFKRNFLVFWEMSLKHKVRARFRRQLP